MKDVKELKLEWLTDRIAKQKFFIDAEREAVEIMGGLEEIEQAYWLKLEELNEQTHIGEHYADNG